MKNILFPLLALCGICAAIAMIFLSAQHPPHHPIICPPAYSPYQHYVAGEGIIESFNQNINIGVPFPEIITEQYVHVGDQVQKGDPLFKLDTRQLEADLQVALKEYDKAHTDFLNKKEQFNFYENLHNKNAVSASEYRQAYYQKQLAHDQLHIMLSQINQIKTHIIRSVICAPEAGIILQDNSRIGEVANVNPFDNLPLMILGANYKLQVRIEIAEEDAWRVVKEAAGCAFIRGNTHVNIPLVFSYIEPLMVAKKNISGSNCEAIDTRVLQIVYEFEKNNYPIYIGQLLDVFLESKPSRDL